MEPGRAAHWQAEWAAAGLAEGRRDDRREKFYALVAYPGASGFLHVGHLRGLLFADAFVRYQRARGRAVLFPFGLHASGLPAVSWAQRIRDRDPATLEQLRDAGLGPDEWARLEDPEAAARYLGDEYRRVLRRAGVLFDESTYVTTIDEDYRAFVRWQMRTLHGLGAIRQAPYFAAVCPVCGPIAVDRSETDLSSGGDAEVVRFVTVPFRMDDGRTLLAATLRAETVYGVTNLWVAPGEELVVWHHGADEFVVARDGGERLVEQHGGHLGHAVSASALIGRAAKVPLSDREVPILASRVVDPTVGTGVVMSVPAHAPADAAALAELPPADRGRLIPPPVLLEIPHGIALTASEEALVAGEGTPAERALRATGARGLSDADALTAATERLYRLEFVRGRMTVPALAGVPVRDARERVAKDLLAGAAFELREFSKPVICRNGHVVVIRRLPDQWFLAYGDPGWKARTKEALASQSTWPDEYGRDLPGIIDWFEDRPCARKGRWLGTPLPFDPAWVIEPIADSTFYMAYFIVRRFVAGGRLTTAQLTDALFDHVFRGIGPGEPSVDPKLTAELREEFLYWYPLDMNIGGKEHRNVHFPVFLFTHARLLPPELAPRGVFVHGWVTGPAGAKISKKEISKKHGGIPPVHDALDRWGPDPLRLYYASVAAPASDVEWSSEAVDAAADRLGEVERLVRETRGSGRGPPELDAWLASQVHRLILRARAALDDADPRVLADVAYVTLPALVRRYYARGGVAGDATEATGRAWIRLLGPITPHLAEELAVDRLTGLVAAASFPTPEEFALAPDAEAREAYLDRVEDDLRAVLHPARERAEPPPDGVAFFVAAPWKAIVETWIREALASGTAVEIRSIMERARAHPELEGHLAEIPKYVQRVAPVMRGEPAPGPVVADERATLAAAEGYLTRRFGFGAVTVVREEEGEAHDPLGRRDRARPGRPAFYLVTPGRRSGAP
jgi:leucyl-tRNA synthetase